MEPWQGWPLARFIYLFFGLAYLLVWAQVGLLHWRGAFRHWSMWVPVLLGPLLALMGILYVVAHGGALDGLFVVLFALGALVGLVGTYFHLRGVQYYIGGFTLRNFLVGPPVVLPFIFFALSAAALLVYILWSGGRA